MHLLDLCGMSGGTVHGALRTCEAEIRRCKSEYVQASDIQTQILRNCSPSTPN
jgi:hypothetical protein